MPFKLRLPYATALILAAIEGAVSAQWLEYPTRGVPRTPDGTPDMSAPAPRTADGRTGLERHVGLGNSRELRRPLQRFPALTGVHQHRRKPEWGLALPTGSGGSAQEANGGARPGSRMFIACRAALREIWTDDYYKRIFQVSDRVIILTERNMQYRQISSTDGRALPDDPNPTWNGYSTATWEGETLVVQTIGFKDDLWLDANGNPLTGAAKLTGIFAGRTTERWKSK